MDEKSVSGRWRGVGVALLLAGFTVLAPQSSEALQSVTLAWNPSVDSNVVGYNIYYGGASRSYTNKINVGNVTTVTINELIEGRTYYFAATAYNVLGIESDFSEEVFYTVPMPAGNQPPTIGSVANITLNEDAGARVVNLSGIGAGAPNENQALTVTASSSNTGLIPHPTVSYTSPNTTGSLTFTPAPDAYGTASISVRVNDGQATNNLVTRTFTVTVNPVNDPPAIAALSNVTVDEDSGPRSVNLSGITAGPNESQLLTVTASSSNPSVVPHPVVQYSSPNGTGTLTFAPAANANGTATITVSVDDGQLANNTAIRTFTVTVNAVNDAPTLNTLNSLALQQNAGRQVVNLSGITSGASNENQDLTVTATSSNPGLIPTPAISYNSPSTTGSLSFTPAAGESGSATITVTVNDRQSANSTVSRSFTVTVNGAPVISTIANQMIGVNSNSGPIGFTISDPDNAAGSLTLTGSSSLQSLIPNSGIVFGGGGGNRTVTLRPTAGQTGSANITLTVSDGVTSASTTFQLQVLGAPTPPSILTIVTNGEGTVATSASIEKMTVGGAYTLEAKPKPGQEFAGWSGSVKSSSPKIVVMLNSNLVIHANFVPSPYLPIAGSYNGLTYEDEGVRLRSAGSLLMRVTTRGAYTGQVLIGRAKYKFSGQFDLQNRMTNVLIGSGPGPLKLTLEAQQSGGERILAGELTDGNWVATVQADLSTYSKVNPAPFAGTYTFAIPGSDAEPGKPAGHSYGSLKLDTSGRIRFAGALADGTKVSQSAVISDAGTWPFYAPLFSGAGTMMSWIRFADRDKDDLSGEVIWIRPPSSTSRYYAGGFTTSAEAIGSRFVPPVGQNILNLSNAEVEFEGGQLGDGFSNSILVGLGNKVANMSTNAMSLKFSTKNGTFKGKVTDPSSGKAFAFGGAVLNKMNAAYGYLMGTAESSAVYLKR